MRFGSPRESASVFSALERSCGSSRRQWSVTTIVACIAAIQGIVLMFGFIGLAGLWELLVQLVAAIGRFGYERRREAVLDRLTRNNTLFDVAA